jgi:hypothetical protein
VLLEAYPGPGKALAARSLIRSGSISASMCWQGGVEICRLLSGAAAA